MFKLLEFYSIPSLPNSGYRLDGKIHLICDFLGIMTLCDNLVIADRVSIFANACGFQYRLLSNRLNRPDISYVTCLLVLLLANLYLNIEVGKQMIVTYWDNVPSYDIFADTYKLSTMFKTKYSLRPQRK
jgi:hypothetical protein